MKALVMVVLLTVSEVLAEDKRPLWIIGNMVNSIKQIREFLNLGANAIEADASFTRHGDTHTFFHGIPCDCLRSCLASTPTFEYLNYIHNETALRANEESLEKQLVLLKIVMHVHRLTPEAKYNAGVSMVSDLDKHYWRGKPDRVPYLQISLPNVGDVHFINGFLGAIKTLNVSIICMDYIGWDIKSNELITEILNMFEHFKLDHVWLSDGDTACTSRGFDRLNDLIHHRDKRKDLTALKIYTWSYNEMSTMKSALTHPVDAIVVNNPDRVEKLLKQPFFADKYRRATKEDNPWKKFVTSEKTNVSSHDIINKK